MSIPKQERLNRMTDEVEQFHPLLYSILRKIPGVQTVEYTHGTGEMGADFVFSRIDPVLHALDYVAVVAKLGRLAQDFTDIERQIDECSLPRTFDGGKERIRVNEIWVAVSRNITKNAQAKIHEKFANRKIVFLSGSRLIGLIDDFLPLFWTDVSIPAGEYLSNLQARNEEADRSLSLIQLGDATFYLDQDIYEYPRLQYRLKMERKHKTSTKIKFSRSQIQLK